MSAVVADTNAVIWYLNDLNKLSSAALVAFNEAVLTKSPIYISSITVVEIIYLVEKKRLPEATSERLKTALAIPNIILRLVPLDYTIAQAVAQIPRDIVPDMPDRIIAATALHLNLPLVTSDHKIQATTAIQTIW